MNTCAYKTVYTNRYIMCDRKRVQIDPSDRLCALFCLLGSEASDFELFSVRADP